MTSMLVNLRAEVAMRREDLRIARKHRDEAERRVPAGTLRDAVRARAAQKWADECERRYFKALDAAAEGAR